MKAIALLIVAAGAAVAGWRLDLRALLASYLAAWWYVTGALLGGLANVWLHQLTGGAWGETIRAPLLRAARWLPLACLLFLPVLNTKLLLEPVMGHQYGRFRLVGPVGFNRSLSKCHYSQAKRKKSKSCMHTFYCSNKQKLPPTQSLSLL